MIPKECKRLAEVDFPIAAVSKYSVIEKSVRYGHPSTLHLWWARRPLAACRAVLMTLLMPDPCDPNCPKEFNHRARNILPRVQGKVGPTNIDLRNELLRFVGDFSNWDNASSTVFLEAARGLVQAAHGDELPLVVDPFAGGGSIPLEALRLGCDAFASDLNPVASLIQRIMLEDIPRYGPCLADQLRKVGDEIKVDVQKELADLYPSDADGANPIAYLWARSIICDNCGAEVPLVRSFWLSKKSDRKRALRYTVIRPKGKPPHLLFEVFTPKSGSDLPAGTVRRAKATCPCCHIVMAPNRVRMQLTKQRGGANVNFNREGERIGGATLLAVVKAKKGGVGRDYRVASSADYLCVWRAEKRLKQVSLSIQLPGGISPI